ncbi:MAG: Uma2 family endonuclease [Phormidesmis sp.]
MVQTPSKSKCLSLELPEALSLQVTPAQFEMLATANRDLRLERTATGELIVNPPTGWETGGRNFSLTGQFARWHEAHYELGKAFDSSTGFTLPNGAILSPDLSWISQARWDLLRPDQKTTFPHICPDFVVELRAHSDTFRSLQQKLKEYIENGTSLGWLIDPKRQQVEIYRQAKAVELLAAPTELSGEDLLPGFVLNLLRIWT